MIRSERQRVCDSYIIHFDKNGLTQLRLPLEHQRCILDEGKEEMFPLPEFKMANDT